MDTHAWLHIFLSVIMKNFHEDVTKFNDDVAEMAIATVA
jgi:hypothetical protein